MLQEIPALKLRLSVSGILSLAAYILTFTLIEALLIWVIANILAVILPGVALREDYLGKGSMMVVMTYIWLLPLFRNFQMLLYWPVGRSLWIALFFLLLVLIQIAFMIIPELNRKLYPVIDRLAVLSGVYLLFDVAALLIIFVRNLT
jgi:hypothetical protein